MNKNLPGDSEIKSMEFQHCGDCIPPHAYLNKLATTTFYTT